MADNELAFELWFRRQSPGVTFTLHAPTLLVKRAWLAEISCLLWRQAIHNRERRRREMALHCSHDDVTLPWTRDVKMTSSESLISDGLSAVSVAGNAGMCARVVADIGVHCSNVEL